MDPVVHFEMPYDDRDRMAGFYERVFGWKLNRLGEDMGNYVVVQTAETDAAGMIRKPGSINGGFFKRNSESAHPSVVVAVKDINAAIAKIREAGGTTDDTMEIQGIGTYCSFTDTEGNRASILQPKNM